MDIGVQKLSVMPVFHTLMLSTHGCRKGVRLLTSATGETKLKSIEYALCHPGVPQLHNLSSYNLDVHNEMIDPTQRCALRVTTP